MLCFKDCRSLLFAVIVLSRALAAHATVYYTSVAKADCSTPSHWKTAGGDPCTVITADDELVCKSTGNYATGSGTYTSKQLTIGEETTPGRLYCSGHVTFANKGLFCQCGYATRSGSNYNINGDVTITASSDNPFGFYGDWGSQASSCGIVLNGTSGTLRAEKGTGIAVGGRMVSGALTPSGSAGFRVTFNNYSEYFGDVTVLSSYDNAVCASGASVKNSGYCWGAALWLANAGLFPGSIRLCSGGGLYLKGAGETVVSNLTLEAGSTIRTVLTPASASCNSVRAEQLSVTGPVYISASYAAVATTDDSEISCKLLTAPAGVRLDPEDFVFVPSAKGETDNETIPQRAHLQIETENGVDSLYIVVEPIVTLDVADSSERNASSSGVEYSSALMTPTSWSDQQLPHGGLVYRVAKNLRTTATGTEDPEGESSGQDYVFPATEFFHDAGTFMLGGTRTITISNYVWRGGIIHTMQGANPTLAGKMRLAENSATRTIRGWATLTLTIESDISGTGLITLENVNTSSACAITELAGDNMDFTGTFLLNNRYSSASLSKYVQLNFSEPRNLGGALAEPDFRAIELRNYCKLNFLDDMTLDAASNRGIFSQTNGVLMVAAGKTATVRWPITLRGTLHKAGLGTLELAGALRFYDAETDSAVDARGTDSAVISLREGALRIGFAKSCDGATVSVLKDTSIVLPVAEQGSELARLGLYDVKAGATPFALGTGVSELPISFAETAAVPEGCSVLTNALVTVANSAVASVRPMVSSLRLKPFGHKSSIVEIPVEGEDATTFACVTEVKGLVLIFR